MARFMRAIQFEASVAVEKKLDGPDKPGHDGGAYGHG
jgi:hypothetical protein